MPAPVGFAPPRRTTTHRGRAVLPAVVQRSLQRQHDDCPVRAGFQGWIIIAIFFGLVGTWCAFAPLDGAVVVEGVVKVDGNRKSVQHREGGIVRRIHVREGDTVAAGDALVSLDDTETRAGFDVLDETFVALSVSEARLVVEETGSDAFRIPAALQERRNEPRVVSAIRGQLALIEARSRERAGEAAIAQERIGQLATQIRGSKAQLDGLEVQAASMREELASLKPLLAEGIVTRQRLMQLERTLAQISGQIGEVTASIARSQQAIAEQRRLALQLRNQQATAIAQELRDVRMRLAEVVPKLASARAIHARSVIRAPYAGRVVGLNVFGAGAVLNPGERILDIVPSAESLVVEARVGVNDVTELAQGAAAEVRFTAFNQRTTPLIAGQITQISADRLTDPRTSMPYYVATVRLEPGDLERLGDRHLVPGLAATVTVPTRSRTALEYLLDPLRASFSRALRER
ncbi:MAG: HlyD family type I secretion periplasmic adaptor subunit [Hyphomicrobiaceae bacterium]